MHRPTPLQEAVRLKRLAARVTQGQLAAKVGKQQSALSMWENGDDSALAYESVVRICVILGIDLQDLPTNAGSREASRAAELTLKACFEPGCFSQTPIMMQRLVLRPRAQLAERTASGWCAECGAVLVAECPHCGRELNDGAVCVSCGNSYVEVSRIPHHEQWLADRHVALAHAKLREKQGR